MKICWMAGTRVGIVVAGTAGYVFATEVYRRATTDAVVYSPELMEFSSAVLDELSLAAQQLVQTGECSKVYWYYELEEEEEPSDPHIEFRVKPDGFDIRDEIGIFAANEIVRIAITISVSAGVKKDVAIEREITNLLSQGRYADAVAFATIFKMEINPWRVYQTGRLLM